VKQDSLMMSLINSPDDYQEGFRLKNLLPVDLDSRISIRPFTMQKTWLVRGRRPLISTHKTAGHSFLITIDFQRWRSFDEDARNLLWWHQIAFIQQHSLQDARPILVAGIGGLALAASQLVTQDVVMLSIGLTIAGLAGFQLYQNRRGERYIRQLTRADQGAILIAKQFGYSPVSAAANLHSALKILIAQVKTGQLAKVYQTRLQVLEICDQLQKTEYFDGKQIVNIANPQMLPR
jgi:Protein of unknown function (DUF3318)